MKKNRLNQISIKDFRPHGVTGTGKSCDLFYHEYLTGPQGARYNLLKEFHHNTSDVLKAKSYLKQNFDAVQITVFNEIK